MKTINTADQPNPGAAPGAQTPPPPPRSPSDPTRPYTMPTIRAQLAQLWWPLSARGRAIAPFYYLVEPKPRIAPAPTTSRARDKHRRTFLVLAIALWWPTARALTAAWVTLRPPSRSVVSAWYKRIAVARGNPAPAPAPSSTGGSGLPRPPAPARSMPHRVPSGDAAQPTAKSETENSTALSRAPGTQRFPDSEPRNP